MITNKPADALSKHFHDLNNTVGAIAMNLEVANDPTLCSGTALESVQDALAEMTTLKLRLLELRRAVQPGYGER
jgi:hypothetical protein